MPASPFFWYELMTTDIDAAAAFYAKVVGWTPQEFPNAQMRYTVMNSGDRGVCGVMLLPEEAKAGGTPPSWIGYIHAKDVDKATENLRQAGGAVYREPMDIPDVGRFSVVADPQGATFMLMTPNGPDMPPIPRMQPGQVGWIELYANDWQSALDFYSKQFGWSEVRRVDMGEKWGTYLVFATGGDEGVGGMMNRPPHLPVPFWQFYFSVADINAAATRVTDSGGSIMMGPMQVPDGSWVLTAKDPQGAVFSLVAPKA